MGIQRFPTWLQLSESTYCHWQWESPNGANALESDVFFQLLGSSGPQRWWSQEKLMFHFKIVSFWTEERTTDSLSVAIPTNSKSVAASLGVFLFRSKFAESKWKKVDAKNATTPWHLHPLILQRKCTFQPSETSETFWNVQKKKPSTIVLSLPVDAADVALNLW